MNTSQLVIYFVSFQATYAQASFWWSIVERSEPFDLSALESRWKAENSPFGALLSLYLAIARLSGIALLVYAGFQIDWWFPLVMYAIGLAAGLALTLLLRPRLGQAELGLACLPVSVIFGALAWFAVTNLSGR